MSASEQATKTNGFFHRSIRASAPRADEIVDLLEDEIADLLEDEIANLLEDEIADEVENEDEKIQEGIHDETQDARQRRCGREGFTGPRPAY